jgi:phospholipase D1/2
VSSYICVVPATTAGEEPISAETGKNFLHKNHETSSPSVGDRALGEEDFDEKGQIASSVVRILKEKAIIEKRPSEDQTFEATLKDRTIIEESESVSVQSRHTGLVNDGPHEPSTMDSLLLGAQAKHKSSSLRSDPDSEEHATLAASAKETLRDNLGSRSGRKPWTVPTMKPKVEPQDFEDPISDAFWKNIWVASAVHNVSASSWTSIIRNSMLC